MFGQRDDLKRLKVEQAERQAALAEVSQKVQAIETAEREKREAEEQRARELAALTRKVEKCGGLIGFSERKIAELRTVAEAQASGACEDRGWGEFILSLSKTAGEILAWERVIVILRERGTTYQSEIQKLSEAQ